MTHEAILLVQVDDPDKETRLKYRYVNEMWCMVCSFKDLFRWSMFCVSPEPRLHAALLSALHRDGRGVQLQVIPHIMQIIQEFKVQRDLYCQSHGLSSLSRKYLRRKRRAEAAVDAERANKSYEDHIAVTNAFINQISRLFQIIQMLTSTEILEENEIRKSEAFVSSILII